MGTTLIIRVGRARYTWVTLLPLAWVLAVTTVAGWQKMFAADPHLGFLAHAAETAAAVAAGTLDAARGSRLVFNDRVDTALCGLFLLVTWAVVVTSARVWLVPTARTAALEPAGEAA